MLFLRTRLFSRVSLRCFILLDMTGICRALRHSAQAPQGLGWIEVEHASAHWLGQALPRTARIVSSPPARWPYKAAAA
jgi:hypothetical protein